MARSRKARRRRLQELKCADESLPIADIEAAGYGAVWHGQKGFNGVAILASGDAPELRRVGLPGDPDDTPQPLYRGPGRQASIVGSIYLPNGNPVGTEKFDYKLRWMERLRATPPSCWRWSGRWCSAATGTWSRRTATSSRSARPSMTRSCSRRRGSHGGGSSTRAGPTRCARSIRRRAQALHLLGLYRRLLAARPGLPAGPSCCARRKRRTG